MRDLNDENAAYYLDAIRLALEGASDPSAAGEVIEQILAAAPTGDPESTVAPAILVAAIRERGMVVTTA